MVRYAAVEGGGTSWVAVVAEGSVENIVARENFETLDPESTLRRIKEWLIMQQIHSKFDAIGGTKQALFFRLIT